MKMRTGIEVLKRSDKDWNLPILFARYLTSTYCVLLCIIVLSFVLFQFGLSGDVKMQERFEQADGK